MVLLRRRYTQWKLRRQRLRTDLRITRHTHDVLRRITRRPATTATPPDWQRQLLAQRTPLARDSVHPLYPVPRQLCLGRSARTNPLDLPHPRSRLRLLRTGSTAVPATTALEKCAPRIIRTTIALALRPHDPQQRYSHRCRLRKQLPGNQRTLAPHRKTPRQQLRRNLSRERKPRRKERTQTAADAAALTCRSERFLLVHGQSCQK